jgi:hypothetical protein
MDPKLFNPQACQVRPTKSIHPSIYLYIEREGGREGRREGGMEGERSEGGRKERGREIPKAQAFQSRSVRERKSQERDESDRATRSGMEKGEGWGSWFKGSYSLEWARLRVWRGGRRRGWAGARCGSSLRRRCSTPSSRCSWRSAGPPFIYMQIYMHIYKCIYIHGDQRLLRGLARMRDTPAAAQHVAGMKQACMESALCVTATWTLHPPPFPPPPLRAEVEPAHP